MADDQLHLPPFPPLDWDEYVWTGEVVLSTWAGFQARSGPHARLCSTVPSGGLVRLVVNSEDAEERAPPTAAQTAAFQWLLDRELPISKRVLDALFLVYPKMKERFRKKRKRMPELARPDDLKALLGLATLHLLEIERAGFAYLGFEFGCSWDEQRGLGLMLHKDRIIGVGEARLASLEWLAEEDAEREPDEGW